jgi:hypothetical protein
VVSVDRPSFNIEPRTFFFNLKGHCPLISIKLVLPFNDHKISLVFKLAPTAKNL